jgi:hypothetical protein
LFGLPSAKGFLPADTDIYNPDHPYNGNSNWKADGEGAIAMDMITPV